MARKTSVSFSLDTEGDKDIIRWLDSLPKNKRSESIRAAIRDHLGRGGVTLGDVYQAIKELERKVQAGAVVQAGWDGLSDDSEPPDAAAALDALANL